MNQHLEQWIGQLVNKVKIHRMVLLVRGRSVCYAFFPGELKVHVKLYDSIILNSFLSVCLQDAQLMAVTHQRGGDSWQDFTGACLLLLHGRRTTFNLSFSLSLPFRDYFIPLLRFLPLSHMQLTSHKGAVHRLRSCAGGPCLILFSNSGDEGYTLAVITCTDWLCTSSVPNLYTPFLLN